MYENNELNKEELLNNESEALNEIDNNEVVEAVAAEEQVEDSAENSLGEQPSTEFVLADAPNSTDLEIQRLFRNLTPATTLELIRKGENPLDMEISELNKVVAGVKLRNNLCISKSVFLISAMLSSVISI